MERAYYYWMALAEVGTKTREKIENYIGSIEEMFAMFVDGTFSMEKYGAACGIGPGRYGCLQANARIDDLRRAVERLPGENIQMITFEEDESYPERLRTIYSPPQSLFVRGRLPRADEPVIAVVGARGATPRGLRYAERFAARFAASGVSHISGLAVGIDIASHKGALKTEGGISFAALACGVNVCYPRKHYAVYEDLIERGGVVSEYVPGSMPLRRHFPLRNRLISGLADAVLVVEAKGKSGSLITADMGLEQGKTIFAIPGSPDDPLSEGTNELIRQGAALVTTPEQVLEEMHLLKESACQSFPEPENLLLESDEEIVYATLRPAPRHPNEISSETKIPVERLYEILLHLELAGLIGEEGGFYFIK